MGALSARRLLRALFFFSSITLAIAQFARANDFPFSPLGYRDQGNQVPLQDTAPQACDVWASWWGWDKGSFSYQLIPEVPGRSKCQRYHKGVLEPSQYTYVKGACQRRPAPILTGSDWSHPSYDEVHAPPCYCHSPKLFDRSVEWCTGSPSCLWYPENRATECGRTVDALMQVVKTSADPTSYFHQTQTCIARASCDLRCKMDHCNWMKAVLPEFVGPYLRKQGKWMSIESECAKSSGWLATRMCASEMAAYHIETDLAPALGKFGCGSQADWNHVFGVINTCTAQSLGSAAQAWVASAVIRIRRDRTRAACVAARSVANVNVEVNTDLQGPTCKP